MILSRGKVLKVTCRKAQAAPTAATSLSSGLLCKPLTLEILPNRAFVCINSHPKRGGAGIVISVQGKRTALWCEMLLEYHDLICHTNCKRKRGFIALQICCSKSLFKNKSADSSPTAKSSSTCMGPTTKQLNLGKSFRGYMCVCVCVSIVGFRGSHTFFSCSVGRFQRRKSLQQERWNSSKVYSLLKLKKVRIIYIYIF